MAEEQNVVVEQVEEVTETTPAVEETAAPVYKREQSAAEKKARKAMQKKGLEQVPGISNVSVIRKRGGMFSIYGPDVYKNSTSDTWIVFGEARMENYGRSNPAYQRQAANASASADATPAQVEASAPAAAAEETEEVDEEGVDSKDIELVMSQAGCTRAKAVKALKNSGSDVVNAIMELTLN
ncbi:hypothetical protein LPJ73_002194 [Coemansia sp. RSA 2703]|nr:hypothetical protein LPJ73_002194 [Coemansia sp. RSA 2703]KAJ2366291.1 hypothetical protein IW150_005978 [Coemansia sp. RSA 2607]KAJ2386342.1 hypothetical protein GGI05_004410 [Coemansia sp. RSA 2603]